MHRRERQENPGAPDRYGHIGFPRLVQYVAYFKGWPVALACAAGGLLLTALITAFGVGGAVLGVLLGKDFEPGPLAVGALIAFVTSVSAGELLVRRKPWRSLLAIAATAGSHRRPGTMGLSYRVAGADLFRVKHALLSQGFAYVNEHRAADDGFGGDFQIEVLVAPEAHMNEPDAKRLIESTLDDLGATYRHTGGSYS